MVTVLIAGRPYSVPEIAAQSSALLTAFYPGPMGGQAIAELLLGIIEPGGRLPVSMPRSSGQLPVYYNSRSSYHAMGYHDQPDSPLYAFGDGLSYTEFACTKVQLSDKSIAIESLKAKPIEVTFTIQNIGMRAGWTVPSLYIHGLSGSVVRRTKELRAFEKRFLKPGETSRFHLQLGYPELAVWDAALRFTVEPGSVQLLLEDGEKSLWQEELLIVAE